MRIALIRHAAVLAAPGLCYGRRDVPPEPAAAAAAAARVAALGLARIWTSPARRCTAIAGPAATADARLLELDFGAWEGTPWDAIPRAALDRWAADPAAFAPPGGESGAALIARVRDFHAMLSARAEDAAIVSHGGPLRLLAALLRGEPPDLLAAPPPLGAIIWVAPPAG